MKAEEIKKVYWTIAKVAEMIDVNASTLRFWEDEFDWLNPKRYKSGNRKYSRKDLEVVKSINLLIKGLGMTLDGVRKAYTMGYNKDLELIGNVSNQRKLLLAFKNWEVDHDIKNLFPEQLVDFYLEE